MKYNYNYKTINKRESKKCIDQELLLFKDELTCIIRFILLFNIDKKNK